MTFWTSCQTNGLLQLSADDVQKAIASAKIALEKNPTDFFSARLPLVLNQYIYSWGIRGDNTPESAAYLGYLDFKELYPGVTGKTMRTFLQEILDGKKNDS